MQTGDLAVRARTSVERARVGALTTYARCPYGQRTTSVAVRARPDGTVTVQLGRDALGVRQLLARPLATLHVAPAECESVLLQGAARRLPGLSDSGSVVFHLEVAAVRVGDRALALDERAYFAASPSPVRHTPHGLVSHVNSCHADWLVASLRAAGHEVSFAEATSVDAAGLLVACVNDSGAETVRLRLPRVSGPA